MPDWLVTTGLAVGSLGIWLAIGARNSQRRIARTLARRANLDERQFMALMEADCSKDAAEFLWRTSLFYLAPRLTPHPDDDLLRDLPIHHEDWSMHWPQDYAREQGFHESNLPDWPKEWPITIRNYGRWLSMGPV